MKFQVIEEETKLQHISVDPKDYNKINRYYYFISRTENGYRPIIYGVASKPFATVVLDSIKKLFCLS